MERLKIKKTKPIKLKIKDFFILRLPQVLGWNTFSPCPMLIPSSKPLLVDVTNFFILLFPGFTGAPKNWKTSLVVLMAAGFH